MAQPDIPEILQLHSTYPGSIIITNIPTRTMAHLFGQDITVSPHQISCALLCIGARAFVDDRAGCGSPFRAKTIERISLLGQDIETKSTTFIHDFGKNINIPLLFNPPNSPTHGPHSNPAYAA